MLNLAAWLTVLIPTAVAVLAAVYAAMSAAAAQRQARAAETQAQESEKARRAAEQQAQEAELSRIAAESQAQSALKQAIEAEKSRQAAEESLRIAIEQQEAERIARKTSKKIAAREAILRYTEDVRGYSKLCAVMSSQVPSDHAEWLNFCHKYLTAESDVNAKAKLLLINLAPLSSYLPNYIQIIAIVSDWTKKYPNANTVETLLEGSYFREASQAALLVVQKIENEMITWASAEKW